jgi:hypothetical protein
MPLIDRRRMTEAFIKYAFDESTRDAAIQRLWTNRLILTILLVPLILCTLGLLILGFDHPAPAIVLVCVIFLLGDCENQIRLLLAIGHLQEKNSDTPKDGTG